MDYPRATGKVSGSPVYIALRSNEERWGKSDNLGNLDPVPMFKGQIVMEINF